ncbi:MAG: FAD-binding protein [Roseobacter sp.]
MAPDTEEALAEAILSAESPISIAGGGTRGVHVEGTPLSTANLKGISLYEPGALTIVVQAGTPLSDVEDALAAEKQRLAFEPTDYRSLLKTTGTPTIGGVLATNASGPRRIQGGAARDYALGVRFVDGSGKVVKNGGRVMKNVTGYDLVKLMCGAYGTLGVLSEVSLKVLPVPETSGSLMLRGLETPQAVNAMAAAMGSPFEVTGASHIPQAEGGSSLTALRLEGFEQSVNYRIEQLKTLLRDTGAEMNVASSQPSEAFWAAVRVAEKFTIEDGDVWRVSCKPSDAPRLASLAWDAQHFFDWGGGMIWLLTPAGTDLRAQLGAFDGHATLVRATSETFARLGRFHPETAGVARLSAGLRTRFDPQGILNTGLMDPVISECV